MARHQFTREEGQRGGKARAQQDGFIEACRLGFERILELHPFYARISRLREDRTWQECVIDQLGPAKVALFDEMFPLVAHVEA